MISNENFKVKVKKRQVNTPGFFGNKKAHILNTLQSHKIQIFLKDNFK